MTMSRGRPGEVVGEERDLARGKQVEYPDDEHAALTSAVLEAARVNCSPRGTARPTPIAVGPSTGMPKLKRT